MIPTTNGATISKQLLCNYFDSLVNCFFKILPIRESEEKSLVVYIQSLQSELLGCKELITTLDDDARFLTLLSILQFLIDTPSCPVRTVKREVFKAIRICNGLKSQYGEAV